MNAGNFLLGVVGVVIAGFLFMLSDASPSKAGGGAVGNAQVRAAIASGQPVMLEFYAEWCGPCRTVGPVVDELAREVQGKARVLRLNVDQHGELAREYGVRGIPAFITLKKGKETAREVGAIGKAEMRRMLGM
jgi:thioredoxin 1